MLLAASSAPGINFKMHCVELYSAHGDGVGVSSVDGGAGAVEGGGEGCRPLAGEIGFTIGRVYTSLSGDYYHILVIITT